MMKFIATETRPDGSYCVTIEAADWNEASAICELEGWTLDGELKAAILASSSFGYQEANRLIEAMNESEQATKQ